MTRLRQEVGALAGIEAMGACDTRRQQFLTPPVERTLQLGHKRKGVGGQDGFETGLNRGADIDALRKDHGAPPETMTGKGAGTAVGRDTV
jgi:hypothetical protein